MTYAYNTMYIPPIPCLQIELGVPDEDTLTDSLTGIIDTGADGTIIPVNYLEQIKAKNVDEALISSHWGEWRQVMLYMVDVKVESIVIPGLYVVGDDQGNEIILGRNFLNRLELLLNGPAKIAKIQL